MDVIKSKHGYNRLNSMHIAVINGDKSGLFNFSPLKGFDNG